MITGLFLVCYDYITDEYVYLGRRWPRWMGLLPSRALAVRQAEKEPTR